MGSNGDISEIRHLAQRQEKAEEKADKYADRLGQMEVAMAALKTEVRIWGTIISAAIIAVLTTLIVK